MPIFFLSDKLSFPPPQLATTEGLLAVGGDLSQERLLLAYRLGIFPWFSDGEPILWWSPDPRLVLYPDEFRVPKTLRKIIKKKMFNITMDTAFEAVMHRCRQIRVQNNEGTWIVDDMIDAYCKLHNSGFAHSVEAWHRGKLAGGLYGVSLGGCFFGESMFTEKSNASNVALVHLFQHLMQHGFDMIDCQVKTSHLIRFGAREIPREHFLKQLQKSLQMPTLRGKWTEVVP